MRDRFFRPSTSVLSSSDSLFQRVIENFRQVFTPTRIFPSSANGAPLHLPRWERAPRSGRAQSASLLTHAAILTALALLSFPTRHPKPVPMPPEIKISAPFPTGSSFLNSLLGRHPSDGSGSGGGRTPIPATSGNLLPVSSMQIVRPSLPPKHDSVLPVLPTILDPAAPPVLTSVDKIGLPWMPRDTNSPGPGDSNTIGTRGGRTMGDGPVDGPGGESNSSLSYGPASRFHNVPTAPIRSIPTKRARPSCKEKSRCAFWSARTAAPRKFNSCKESGWASMTARCSPSARGDSFPRMTPRGASSRSGLPSKSSSASSRRAFRNGVTFARALRIRGERI